MPSRMRLIGANAPSSSLKLPFLMGKGLPGAGRESQRAAARPEIPEAVMKVRQD